MPDEYEHIGAESAPAGAPQWGPWWLDEDTASLVHAPTGYYVPLRECQTAAAFVRWLMHLEDKRWFDDCTRLSFCDAVLRAAPPRLSQHEPLPR